MILNLVLLLLVFGTSRKKKLKPYLAGLILGGIKTTIYLFFSSSIFDALFMGIIFGLLGAALVYLFDRINDAQAFLMYREPREKGHAPELNPEFFRLINDHDDRPNKPGPSNVPAKK